MKKSWIILALVTAILALLLVGLSRWANQPQKHYIQGQVEAKRVMVAAKIPGRLLSVLVREGDSVTKDQELALLHSPEIEAKRMQAQGAVQAAEAQFAKATQGARSQEIRAAKAMAERAQEAAQLASTTYERVLKLYNEGVVPVQKKDEAFTQMKTAQSAAEATQAQYEQALAGARSEDKAATAGLVMQAKGSRAEVQAYLDETRLVAPISGEITMQAAEDGEIVAAGMPILAITDLNDTWMVFNIREDFLPGISKGTQVTVEIPALKTQAIIEVYYIAPMADFATWRSSKESGGFDLKTFEVRARPVQPIKGLRPGMSVLLASP